MKGRISGGVLRTAVGPVEAAVAGAGPAVLLVHGTPGSWRQLVPVAEDLAAEHTVVLPSRPGYGATPISLGRSPAEQAAAYAALLDAVAVEEAAVVGVSGGGPSAAAFAARYPLRTRAVVLCCPLAPDRFRLPAALRFALLPGVGEMLTSLARRRRRRQLRDPAALERLIRRELTPAELQTLDDGLRAEVERFLRSHLDAPPGLAGFRGDVAQVRGAVSLPTGVTAPTLVLHGDADTVVPLDHGRAYAEGIAGGRMEVLHGAGHGFLLNRRAEVLPDLIRFIRTREHA